MSSHTYPSLEVQRNRFQTRCAVAIYRLQPFSDTANSKAFIDLHESQT